MRGVMPQWVFVIHSSVSGREWLLGLVSRDKQARLWDAGGSARENQDGDQDSDVAGATDALDEVERAIGALRRRELKRHASDPEGGAALHGPPFLPLPRAAAAVAEERHRWVANCSSSGRSSGQRQQLQRC
ncbi:unnamed protein product [Prorocentrum cordatum]|uniref:Uncharacterized protein n=1 Tax=Prorocentrum cordatum TaxID=2364126 RepID=A0ABN9STN3_9DINO|nr:unnamed protein product [Polarella glacialis]